MSRRPRGDPRGGTGSRCAVRLDGAAAHPAPPRGHPAPGTRHRNYAFLALTSSIFFWTSPMASSIDFLPVATGSTCASNALPLGIVGETFTPEVAVGFSQAFGTYLDGGRILVCRDTRDSGPMVRAAVIAGLLAGSSIAFTAS